MRMTLQCMVRWSQCFKKLKNLSSIWHHCSLYILLRHGTRAKGLIQFFYMHEQSELALVCQTIKQSRNDTSLTAILYTTNLSIELNRCHTILNVSFEKNNKFAYSFFIGFLLFQSKKSTSIALLGTAITQQTQKNK